jgi:excisionase family DNA binding protein
MPFHKTMARRIPTLQGVHSEPIDPSMPPIEQRVPAPTERYLVKIAEAARLLSVSERTVRNLIGLGKLEARGTRRLRRVTVASIRRYAEEELDD